MEHPGRARDRFGRCHLNLPRLIETVQGGHERTEIRPIELSRIGDGLSRGHDRVLLEIPGDIAVLRRSAATAERWRALVAQAFQAAFAAGYRAVHFVRDDSRANVGFLRA